MEVGNWDPTLLTAGMTVEHKDSQRMASSSAPSSNDAAWAIEGRRFEAFISYSRRDSANYAEQLVKALEIRGLAARLDTRDLEFGEKWQQQLSEFIRQADAVMFIVSPGSINSKWCRWELAQVAAQSKRLVPVVHISVDADRIPAEISEIQLFQFRPGEDFNSEAPSRSLVSRLAEGLQRDRGWLQEHAQLNDIAIEWDTNDRKQDFLLRGSNLFAAERWLVSRPKTAPPPNSSQLPADRGEPDMG